ncbi:hypothetical protein M409DRAFT_23255 [Zasmidium cellare ATCC 36951]|uniref:Fungal N-terminal domain-containing protein n=1 Tax=Zasmidium cellare ATCC 36951 TaxID=1080233 RepID=A0A6A6CHW3_ZASCE|nr:uncharacterized protein M409DRAFT_23255 [Zasmidium cellare ATCC 36951]KAF2166621.1 hypothetical protein M409DRAFT_23255 [Zasmidium cellare ATCC 36951]
MAELFGTAAGVLQVAEVGFNLATTLYKYASTVKGAERDIKRIARDVKLTSKVLERTHEQLKADQQAQLCTDDALVDLEDVLDGCREAFQEVDDALNKSMKPSSGKPVITLAEKLKWPLKQDKLEVLRANLEKLKTTLLLMLSVFAYGSKVQQTQAKRTDIKVELSLEKLQIQNLIQAKDEATSRYEELSAAFTKLEMRINDSAKMIPQSSGSSTGAEAISMLAKPGSSLVNARTVTPNALKSGSTESSAVSTRLKECASAVNKLTTSIDVATKRWESQRVLEHDNISQLLRDAEVRQRRNSIVSSVQQGIPDEESASQTPAPDATIPFYTTPQRRSFLPKRQQMEQESTPDPARSKAIAQQDEWLKMKEREAEEYEDRLFRVQKEICADADPDGSKPLFASLKKKSGQGVGALAPDASIPTTSARPKPAALKLETTTTAEYVWDDFADRRHRERWVEDTWDGPESWTAKQGSSGASTPIYGVDYGSRRNAASQSWDVENVEDLTIEAFDPREDCDLADGVNVELEREDEDDDGDSNMVDNLLRRWTKVSAVA